MKVYTTIKTNKGRTVHLNKSIERARINLDGTRRHIMRTLWYEPFGHDTVWVRYRGQYNLVKYVGYDADGVLLYRMDYTDEYGREI